MATAKRKKTPSESKFALRWVVEIELPARERAIRNGQ
jgi:hypothetical protein